MTRKRKTPRRAPQEHFIIDLKLPPAAKAQVLPFTAKVIAMPASDTKAMLFDRRDEPINRIAGLAGAAIRAAKRRDPSKKFTLRLVTHAGVETYAVWRLA